MEQIQSFLPLILIFVVVYFFMIRPQMKRQKQEKVFTAELKKGDRVVTRSGMHGKILEINDETCVLETGAGKIKFEKSAISMEMSKKVSTNVVEKTT